MVGAVYVCINAEFCEQFWDFRKYNEQKTNPMIHGIG